MGTVSEDTEVEENPSGPINELLTSPKVAAHNTRFLLRWDISPVCLLVYIQQQLLERRRVSLCAACHSLMDGTLWCGLCKKDIHNCGNIKNPFLCWLLDRWLKSGKL